MRVTWAVVLLVATVSLNSCSADAGRADGVPTRDVTSELLLLHEIGGRHARAPEEEFGYIGSAAISDEGKLYVLDSMVGSVRRFDAEGAYQNSIGQRGQGPGEFLNPFVIDYRGGELEVWDAALWRTTTFTSSGQLLRTDPVERRPESGWLPSVAKASDGSWLYLDQEIESPHDHDVTVSNGIIRGTATLLRWLPSRGWVQIAVFPGMEAALVNHNGEISLSNAPYPAGPLWTVAPDESYWYADSNTYEIVRLSFDGDTLAHIIGGIQAPEVSDSLWNAFVGGSSGDLTSPAARARAELNRPRSLPVLTRLISSAEGDLWVQVANPALAETEWHVYTSIGEAKYKVLLPGKSRIAGITAGRILAVLTDSLDVQSVAVYASP